MKTLKKATLDRAVREGFLEVMTEMNMSFFKGCKVRVDVRNTKTNNRFSFMVEV